MRLPTIEEINPANSYLDGSSAVETFHGKTLEEVEAMFCEGLYLYISDLEWMGPIAFCFYFKAIVSYVKSESSKEDDTVTALSVPLDFKLGFQKNEIIPALSEIKELVEYIIENWSKFPKDNDEEMDKMSKQHWLGIRDNIDGNKYNYSLPCKPISSESAVRPSDFDKDGSMRLPTFEEICPIPNDLEGLHIVKTFYGKTLEEAEAMFCEALEWYTEDLTFMGSKDFCFYLKAVISYVKGESSKEDDSVFFLSGPLSSMVEYQKDEIGPVLNDVKDLVDYVIENWSKFTDDYEDGEFWKPKWLKIKSNLS